MRFHCCWGSWHGPHTTDIELKDIVDLHAEGQRRRVLVRGRQRAPRARVARLGGRRSCRTARSSCPGVVSHATNVVEHPELVADRIERFANVGRPPRTSSRRPTAASAAACTRRSRGRSSSAGEGRGARGGRRSMAVDPAVPDALALILALARPRRDAGRRRVRGLLGVGGGRRRGGRGPARRARRAVRPHQAWDALGDLGPTAAFLAALLVLAEAAGGRGCSTRWAAWLAAGARGSPRGCSRSSSPSPPP